MDLATFHRLLTAEGQRLLERAAAFSDLRDDTFLRHLSTLRRLTDPGLAAAVLETVLLRRRAAAKFTRAGLMYFTRDGLEQASAELVGRHRAARFAGRRRVADLGCGIGGDTLTLAGVAGAVTAVDRDPLRLAMTAENARISGVAERVRPLAADLLDFSTSGFEGAFFDPARRTEDGRRIFNIDDYQPPLARLRAWLADTPALGVKVAPGIRLEGVAAIGGDPEVEFISVAGDLREAALWFGPLRTAARRATLLPSGVSLVDDDVPPAPTVASPGAFLLEPDPAIYRAGLLGVLAAQLGAWQIDATIAYLSRDVASVSPFVRTWPVEEVLPFSVKGARAWLRARNVGAVTVKKRGSPLDPQEFERMLRLTGSAHRTIFLTRAAGKPVTIICANELCS